VGKMEARGDVAAVTLTTSTGYSQKVEFPKNLFEFIWSPFSRLAPTGNKKSEDQKHERRWAYRESV
jgi:hypothetical protein